MFNKNHSISIPFLNGKPHTIVFLIKEYKESSIDNLKKISFSKVKREICKIIASILGIEKFFNNNPSNNWFGGKQQLDFLKDTLIWCKYELNLSDKRITELFCMVQKGFSMRKENKKNMLCLK